VRLFVALHPPPAAVEDAATAVGSVRERVDGPRWVPPARWHLTLAFYGEVPDDEVARINRRVARAAAAAAPMDLSLRGAGAFAGRAVWLGVTGTPVDLARLRALAGALDRSPQHRPYRPHLTVARLRPGTTAAAAEAAVAALSTYSGPAWTATAVRLVRSRLGPQPAHDDLATWPLGPPAGP